MSVAGLDKLQRRWNAAKHLDNKWFINLCVVHFSISKPAYKLDPKKVSALIIDSYHVCDELFLIIKVN